MKSTPKEKKISRNFEQGVITRDGFLGEDKRQVQDIVQADMQTLTRLGLSKEVIADRLQYFIDEGKKGLENEIDSEQYTIKIVWSRGMLPCPFGEPRLHHKLTIHVLHKVLQKELYYSQLSVHMIKAHGFFGGIGSTFRLDPEQLKEFLEV